VSANAQLLEQNTEVDPKEFGRAAEAVAKNYNLTFNAANVGRTDPTVANRYPEISGDNVYQYLSDLTDISLQSKADGNVLWGRIQGSIYERRAAEYVKEKFDNWGLENVRMQDFPITSGVWVPSAVSVTVALDGGDFELPSAATAFPSGVTPTEGLTLPLEYVGLGSAAELRVRDLNGKIALLYVRVFDGVLMHSGLAAADRIASETDAEGVILWMDLPGNVKHATQLFKMDGWIDSIPWVSVGFEDGLYLRRLIERAPIDEAPLVNLVVEGEFRMEGSSQNVIAEIPGTSDENLIITAHVDGFWTAALDNGTGVAALMELARYYVDVPESERTRNLIFLVTGDHETIGTGGAFVYAQTHAEDIEQTVMALQLEHLAAPGTTNSMNTLQHTNALSPLRAFVSNGNEVIRDALLDAVDRYGLVVRKAAIKSTAGDVDGLKEIPSAGLIQTGYLYHSEADGMQWYQPSDLERATRAHAYLIDQINQIPIEQLKTAPEVDLPPPYSSPDYLKLMEPW
jgi:hypothetical protein